LIADNDSISAKELARRLDVRPPSLSRIIERLEQQGSVVRTRDEADSRVWHISITEQGKDEIGRYREEPDTVTQAIQNNLTEEEIVAFNELAQKLSDGLVELTEQQSESLKHERPGRLERKRHHGETERPIARRRNPDKR